MIEFSFLESIARNLAKEGVTALPPMQTLFEIKIAGKDKKRGVVIFLAQQFHQQNNVSENK